MKVTISICDICRGDGEINVAAGYCWDARLGRIVEVCSIHAAMHDGVVAYYGRTGGLDEDIDVFSTPSFSAFAEIPDEIKQR